MSERKEKPDVTLAVSCEAITAKALLLDIYYVDGVESCHEKVWIPKSQITKYSIPREKIQLHRDTDEPVIFEIKVKAWIAEAKELVVPF